MNGSASKRLFWGAIIAQVVGAQVFFWDALPDYRELTAGEVVAGTPEDFAFAMFGLVVMHRPIGMLAVFSLKSGSVIGLYWVMSCSVLARSVSFSSARWQRWPCLIIGGDRNLSSGN
jgi:hypothetical protein